MSEDEIDRLPDNSESEVSSTQDSQDKNDENEQSVPNKKSIPFVLEPDHPMMERFQVALKNHLQKQIEKYSNQIFDMETEIKKKEKEKEETGLVLYDMQQEMFRQQKTLEDCENSVENLMKERQSLDEALQSKRNNWKDIVNRLNSAKKKENEMVAELHKLSSLEKQMEKWVKDMDSELYVSQKISEKTQHDKNKLIEEKRKMDICLLRLMTSISNYEAEIRLLEGEIEVKIEEKDGLNQTLADAAADLQALITEQKRLLTAWNSVVATINQRNIIYMNGSKELTECQEAFRSLNAEIESYKRSSAEEMKKSEKLAILCSRVETDYESGENALKNLMDKKNNLEDKIVSLDTMIQRTEVDFEHTKIETAKIETDLNGVRSVYDKLHQEKRHYEDEAMNYIQKQISDDKTAILLNKLLKEAREKTRKQEFNMLETENKISQRFLEVEELKEMIIRNNDIINETNKELNAKEEEFKKYEDEINKCKSAAIQKHGNYASLTRKIEKHLEKTGYGKAYQSPLQLHITELEKLNASIQAKNDKMQSYWLLQQSNNVKLTQQRNEQLKDISVLRKQVLLLQQRALKLERSIEKEVEVENNVNKSITHLQHRLVVLNEVLIGKKGYKNNLGKENSLVQAQFIQNLKDSELEQIRLKAEIKDLEGNIEELAETMLSTQREMLAWEKKIQGAMIAKNNMQKEKSNSGEVGQMKAEIHRMEVRYGQLKKVQEKLICDLEQCVLRRDIMVDGAEAMEKRSSKAVNTRFTFQKKVDTLKGKIRAAKKEHKQIDKIIADRQEGHKELKKTILEKETHLMQMDETTKKMDLQLEEGKLQKIQNLEMLVRRQKKCKMYDLVKNRRHRLLFKNEETLENELQKVRNTNTNLISIMEALIEDFPGHRFQLKRIFNTFQAKPS